MRKSVQELLPVLDWFAAVSALNSTTHNNYHLVMIATVFSLPSSQLPVYCLISTCGSRVSMKTTISAFLNLGFDHDQLSSLQLWPAMAKLKLVCT